MGEVTLFPKAQPKEGRAAWGEMHDGTLAEREQSALRAALPPLAPQRPEPASRGVPEVMSGLGIRLTSGAALPDRFHSDGRPEEGDVVARLTVYTLNLTVMVFAFPVGFALMLFNILGGENLRTTAHVLALTGLGLVLAGTKTGAQLFGLG